MNFKCAYDKIVDVTKLVPNPHNPNKHPQNQIELLAKIIDFQGQRSPIVVSNRSGFITKGHGRLLALLRLGWKEAAVDYQDYENEAQEYADMVADNKIAELSTHDDVAMIERLKEINFDLDFELLGIEDFQMPDEKKNEIEDEVPEVDKSNVKTKLGDIYELGNHRLLCGDSTDKDTVYKLMNGNKADMVFTDPPYNHASEEKLVSQSVRQAMKKLSESQWDKNFDFKNTFNIIDSFRSDNCTVYICTSWHLAGSIWEWMKAAVCSGLCVWHKPNPMPSLMKRHWTWATEIICYATYGKHIFNFPEQGHASNVWTFNKNLKNDLHPTMKPVELCEHPIRHSSNAGNSVLDLFGGSGSTLIACEKTNRKCFMMELDPHYCDVIVSRYVKYSGNSKIKLNGKDLNWTLD